jgi:hypothetical protein
VKLSRFSPLTLGVTLRPVALCLEVLLSVAVLAACGGDGETALPSPSPSLAWPLPIQYEVGQRIALASGLSVVIPEGERGSLSREEEAPGVTVENLLADVWASSWLSQVSFSSVPDESADWGALGRMEKKAKLVGASNDGRVKVLWKKWPSANWLIIFTRLADHAPGVIWYQDASADNVAEAKAEARWLWRQYSVRGAELPW